MNFQRGLSVKEAVNVGQVAIAPEIIEFFELDPSLMISATSKTEKTQYVPKAYAVSSPQFIHNILEKIQNGTNEKKLRFYSVRFAHDITKHRVSDYKGLYLKFEEKTYKIPE